MPENRTIMIPSAKRLIKSLRDTGYDFKTAVADVIDNSMEAGATKVNIDIIYNGSNSKVRITDNGLGMDNQNLQEAMRFGSIRDYEKEMEMGKFGLGLKLASLSQCRRLTLVSRSEKNTRNINGYYWDLDHIEDTDRWEILKIEPGELLKEIEDYFKKNTGTMVIWQKLDRILNLKYPEGKMAHTRLANMCRELEEHLAMVFHKFLAGEVPNKKITIYLNENKVEPWDPFCRSEEKTIILQPTKIRINNDNNESIITIQPYVLPHQNNFSSRLAFDKASGPEKWNRQQGFYIYRANRMIHSGGWLGLRTIDEHTKLARVSIDFSPLLDEEFKVNISKKGVQIPARVRDEIGAINTLVCKQAQEVYRNSEKKPNIVTPPEDQGKGTNTNQATGSTVALPNRPGATIDNTPQNSSIKRYTLDEIREVCKKHSLPSEMLVITTVLRRVEKHEK